MAKGGTFFIDAGNVQYHIGKSLEEFPGSVEKTIESVLHNQAPGIIQPAIQNLMPVSGKHWKGKKPAAKASKSLRDKKQRLAIIIRTDKNYQYLYFPDDGTNTRRHVGNQRFFERGAESVKPELYDRCIKGIIDAWDDKVGRIP